MPVIEPGVELPALTLTVTREQIVRYAGASTDFNPIHYSDHAARSLGLPGCLAHGMWTMGAALRVVTDWIGDPAKIVGYFTRFAHPVLVPDDGVGATVEVGGVVKSVADGLAVIEITAVSAGNKVLAAAKVQVKL